MYQLPVMNITLCSTMCTNRIFKSIIGHSSVLGTELYDDRVVFPISTVTISLHSQLAYVVQEEKSGVTVILVLMLFIC